MTADKPSPPVSEHRIRARRLLKQLRRPNPAEKTAAARFQRLSSFAGSTVEELLARRDGVKLKHALAVIALEQGHESWPALKRSTEAAGGPPVSERGVERELYDAAFCGTLNRWFTTYGEARSSLRERGGFLLPHGRQFFVCEERGIRALSLDPEDPDWERIGRDWVEPGDREAWYRLEEKRRQAATGGIREP